MDNRALLPHQVHPAKLGTDITAEVASCILLWQRNPQQACWPGWSRQPSPPRCCCAPTSNPSHTQPAAGTSWLTCRPRPRGIRAAGDVLTAWGSWRRSAPTILAGAVMIAAGWSFGLRPRRNPVR